MSDYLELSNIKEYFVTEYRFTYHIGDCRFLSTVKCIKKGKEPKWKVNGMNPKYDAIARILIEKAKIIDYDRKKKS